MYNWHKTVLPRINLIAEKDRDFLQIRQRRDEIESACAEILSMLPQSEKELIEDYFTHCEDMEYRKAQIAYLVGVEDGKEGKQCVHLK